MPRFPHSVVQQQTENIMKPKVLVIAMIAMLAAACTKNPVEVTCTSIEGKSEKIVGIPEEPYNLSSTGDGDSRTLELVTKFELKKHLGGISGLKPEDIVIDEGFCVSILDEDRKKLCDLKLASDSAAISLKTVLKGKTGDKQEVKFALKTDEDNAKEVMKYAKYFKVNNFTVSLRNINLSGDIGTYPVKMTLNIDSDGAITGAYYYTRKGPNALLYLKGKIEEEKVDINEFDLQGNFTGEFHGKFVDEAFGGMFTTAALKTYNYTLRPDEQMTPIDTRSVPFDRFERLSLNTGLLDEALEEHPDVGTASIDDLLASYERCVDRCISIMSKIKNNDPSAVTEYMGLLSDIADYTSKLDNLKGDFTDVQLDRLARIAAKAAKIMNLM